MIIKIGKEGLEMKKVRFYGQIQQTECGLCCVKMLMDYYGRNISMTTLRNEINVGRDGASIISLQKLLEKNNLITKIVKITADELFTQKGPAIVYWENKHFVIFEKVKKHKVYIVDPNTGRQKVSLEEFTSKFSNYVIFSKPAENFEKINNRYEYWKIFMPVILSDKKKYLKVGVYCLIGYVLTLLSPVLMQGLIDNVYNPGEYWKFVQYFGLFVIATAISLYVKNIALIKLRMNIDKNLTSKVVNDLLQANYSFFDSRSSSDLIFSLNGCTTLRELFANQVVKGVVDVGGILFITAYFFYKSKMIGIVVILIFLLNILYVSATNPIAVDYSKSYIDEQSKLQGKNIELIQSMLGIKMLSIEQDMFRQWQKQFSKFQKKFYVSERMTGVIDVIGGVLQMASPLVVLLLSFHLMLKGNITLGTAMSLYSISSTYFSLTGSAFNMYWCFVKANIYVERLGDISSQEKEDLSGNHLKKHNVIGKIQLKDVSFSYTDTGRDSISNVSMEIEPGQKIAIVGKSGCGKSTLAKLIIGLYKPKRGAIYYDEVEESQIDMGYLRQQFGIVPQEAALFNKSIYDNITLDRPDISMEDVIRVTKIVNIYDEIQDMPLKFNTIISDTGGNLSGGQKQRIILARALISNPKILVLDEATSALDNLNEAMLSAYLKEQGCTRVVIAHRLSTIIDADSIIVMEKGSIVEMGTHEELLKKSDKYYNIYYAEHFK